MMDRGITPKAERFPQRADLLKSPPWGGVLADRAERY
jgi:hypothetical protein